MDGIFKNLQDLSWWFTALILGPIASALIGFIKGYAQKQWNLFLGWSKERRAQAKKDRSRRVDAWSENESRVILVSLDTIKLMLMFISGVTLTVVTAHFMKLRYLLDGAPVPFMINLALAFMLVLTCLLGLRLGALLQYSWSCLNQFSAKHQLPRLFRGYFT